MGSATYFQMARTWRGLPLGALEYGLAYYLDHWGTDHREAKAGAFEYSPEHEVVTQLRQDLSATPINQEVRQRMLERMVHLTALHTPDTLPSVPLATFLNRAMKLPSSGGDGPPETDRNEGKGSTL